MSARQRVQALVERKDAIEREVDELNEFLARPDVSSFVLVDADGYPNPDAATLIRIRASRHRLAELRTDFAATVSQIDRALAELHSEYRAAHAAAAAPAAPAGSTAHEAEQRREPRQCLAVVGEVKRGSPAERAGMRDGDRVVEFGSATSGGVQAVAAVARASVSRAVRVVVARGDATESLTLVPGEWEGAGIIGCTFKAPS
eukprot:m51a1_g881 hypothetical protein (202) ;mRNA; f:886422-887027